MKFLIKFSEMIERSCSMVVEAPDESFLKVKSVQRQLEDWAHENGDWDDDSDGCWMGNSRKIEDTERNIGDPDGFIIYEPFQGDMLLTEDEDEYREAIGLDEEAMGPPPPLPGQMGLEGIGEDIPVEEVTR